MRLANVDSYSDSAAANDGDFAIHAGMVGRNGYAGF